MLYYWVSLSTIFGEKTVDALPIHSCYRPIIWQCHWYLTCFIVCITWVEYQSMQCFFIGILGNFSKNIIQTALPSDIRPYLGNSWRRGKACSAQIDHYGRLQKYEMVVLPQIINKYFQIIPLENLLTKKIYLSRSTF